MTRKKQFSTRTVGGLLIGFTLMMSGLTGCATGRISDRDKLARLEARLRRANFKIETLAEQNSVLKNRIKIAKNANDNGDTSGEDPQLVHEPLSAFKSGVQLDVPISPSHPSKRQDVSLVPRALPKKREPAKRSEPAPSLALAPPREVGEQADRVLARTVLELLKSGDTLEAERTAVLLEKSYPDSELIAEARFQQGLHYFRKKSWQQADRLFQMTLKSPKAHVRAKAGALLMRGIIARRVATDGVTAGRSQTVIKSNLALSRKTFEYVRKTFPGSPEAKRASRELRSISRIK